MEFLDDSRETSAGQVQIMEALLSRFRLFGFVALMDSIVPYFPATTSEYMGNAGGSAW
jgi:hypothetical protein